MSFMKAIIDEMKERARQKRSEDQLTLGDMIDLLETLALVDGSRIVRGLGDLSTYRDYGTDLAFMPTMVAYFDSGSHFRIPAVLEVTMLLNRCKSILGTYVTSSSGQDYLVGADTPLWVANYNHASGERLVGLMISHDTVWPVTEQEPQYE